MKDPTDIVSEFLQNTAPDKIEAATEPVVAEDATYIALNFENPELKGILPWTGTSKGRKAYTSTFIRVAQYWTIQDFRIDALFGAGEDVAVLGLVHLSLQHFGEVLPIVVLDPRKECETR